jgi:hypothetical protein
MASEALRYVFAWLDYPPDMEKLATDMVLKQAELIATSLNAY